MEDMYSYILPLLKKKPSHIILHIGCNDTPSKSSTDILNEMLELRDYITSVLPTTSVYLSCPVLRVDNAKARLTTHHLRMKMKSLDNIINNDNIGVSYLGKAGLHLNPTGAGRLAIHFLSLMRRL